MYLPTADIRALAVAAECDPRTVRRYLKSQPIIALCRSRIERAVRRLHPEFAASLAEGARTGEAAGGEK